MPETLSLIEEWIAGQRWYSGKSGTPRLRELAALPITPVGRAASIRLLLVADDADPRLPVYQLPLLETVGPIDDGQPGLIGATEGGALYDAPHHPDFAAAVLEAMTGGSPELGDAPIRGSGVLLGEQSNTSIIVARDGAVDLMIKVFRTVQHGDNPDVELPAVLSRAGVPFVPRFFGEVVGEWPDARGAVGSGHLAVVQEFLVGAEDAWRIATSAAAEHRDFTAEAMRLGEATAVMHGALAEHLERRDATVGETAVACAIWHSRLADAVADAPALGPLRDRVAALYDTAAQELWPGVQRIHGDLHLGQILRAPDGGWRFIDFEGEPLRTMSERSRPEPALRDVAGMLRSFDYAASADDAARGEAPSPASLAWTAACRAAFLDGYASVGVGDPRAHPALLGAFELDKAVYEVSYEARNRPAWLPIPLGAIERLVGA